MGMFFRFLNFLSGDRLRYRLASGVNYNVLRCIEVLESGAPDYYKVEYVRSRLNRASQSINDIYDL